MSARKHTAGPWRARCRHVDFKDGMDWPKDEFLQWEVDGPEVPFGRGEFYQADAYLVAAAPDLLLAVDEALHCFESGGPEYAREAASLRAAIAKATGAAS